MNDRVLPYLISLGLIGTGVVWIAAAANAVTSMISMTVGVLTIAVGALSLLLEFRNGAQ
ncbi:hypothetical protein [Bradyrhizobium sp.]|nr:hypothetical protein [Bradyrhizobium sp.]MBV8701614.1 hypothetical protein [Bradyrhizobium sp.]MBV8923518.1 hypothetical protein [Bradyrhizobium sp.]